MIVYVVIVLFGTALTAVLDPSLTEWRLLKTNEERVMFPLKDYILEVKAFRPDDYNTNPSYGELLRVDKSTSMMVLLYAGNWNKVIGRLVWNTIKYDRGRDIAIDECDARYEAYNSFPAGGEKEQIWAWNFFQDYVELTCNGELQYEQNFDEGEKHSRKVGLPEKCRALGDADIDRIIFRHMKGEYIRGRPKGGEEADAATTEPPTTEEPTTYQLPGESVFYEKYPTCDCWTSECNYCSNLECTVKHDLVNLDLGIQVTSKLQWKKLNSIMLYDEEGNALGNFQWNLKRIYLSGCTNCQTPPAVRKIKPGTEALWVFSLDLKDGVLTMQIKMGGEVLYESEMKGKCAERYGKVDRFAFFDTTCENTFNYSRAQMEAGARITPDCAGTCPQE